MTVEHPHAPAVSTMVELLRWRATHQADRVGYRYLVDGEDEVDDLTYGDLDRHCRAVAAWLQARSKPGDRVLMMFEEGHDYLHALYGCMYADVLAVPVHPPDPARLHRTLPRLKNIAADAGVSLVLTTSDIASAAREAFADSPALAEAEWLCLDELDLGTADAWVDPGASPDDIAYLQYTSGSTALPKGVMVSHHNLMHQLTDFDVGYDHSPDSVMVSWLPSTHDLGLVYGRFMPLFIGFPCVYMSPVHFMQRPFRWMKALSTFRGTHSPAPNFGFELAARRSSPEERATLDLSSVQVLLNGGEPIRKESEDAFIETFAPHGLSKAAVTHAMGMSESTAKIVTEPIGRYPARFVHVDAVAYENHEVVQVPADHPNARTVASNGSTVLDTVAAIVDPDSHEVLGEGQVGELWVKGTTVAQGYYGNEEATKRDFQARTANGDGPYLRTGDMAFQLDREIYLSGRLKDVIIIRGQNHHPQDIEWTVGTVHPALRPNCAAAFSIPTDLGEQLVLVTEVYRHKVEDPEQVFAAIRQAIAEHGLAARSLVLMSPRTLPKTSSGKIQRTKAKKLFVSGEIDTLFRWDAADHGDTEEPSSEGLLEQLQAAPPRRRVPLLIDHLSGLAASLLGLDLDDIETDRPLQELGIDSVTAVEMVERVGTAVGQSIPGTLLFDYPTIEAISAFIVDELLGELGKPAVAASQAPMATAAADVAKMSEDEVEAALLAELDDL